MAGVVTVMLRGEAKDMNQQAPEEPSGEQEAQLRAKDQRVQDAEALVIEVLRVSQDAGRKLASLDVVDRLREEKQDGSDVLAAIAQLMSRQKVRLGYDLKLYLSPNGQDPDTPLRATTLAGSTSSED